MKHDERRALAALNTAELTAADVARWHRKQAEKAKANAHDERETVSIMNSSFNKETGRRLAKEWDGVAAFHLRAAELLGG